MPSCPFFEILPYDVRAIIYSYLEPEEHPPSLRDFQPTTFGFLSSCKLAKFEMDDIAACRLAKFIPIFKTQFEELAGLTCNVQISCTPLEYRNAKIIIPFTALDRFGNPSKVAIWKREVLMALHPLLAASFGKVQIHIDCTRDRPQCETPLDRGRAEISLHHLLRDITYMIERINGREDERAIVLDEIFKYESGVRPLPYPPSTPPVRARRICLSWDLRSADPEKKPQEKIVLNGKRHSVIVPGLQIIGQTTTGPTFYELRDVSRCVVEMGIQSETRWKRNGPGSLTLLLNTVSTLATYCHSRGLGEEWRLGLKDMAESEYDEQEKLLSELLWDS